MPALIYYRDLDGSVVDAFDCPNEPAVQSREAGISVLRLEERLPSIVSGKKWKVVAGKLTEISDSNFQTQNLNRDSGLAKIKLTCGLTDREMKVLFGG